MSSLQWKQSKIQINMIDKLKNILTKLRSFNPDDIIIDEVRNNEDIITEYVSEDQLREKGINGQNVSIASYDPYSRITIEIKQEKGQPTDKVTLRDEGDFHDSFFVKVDGYSFSVSASDWKTGDLLDRYGDEILWISDENVKDFTDNYVKERLQKEFKSVFA